MTTGTKFLMSLAALLAIAGFASAQSVCPECDEDGDGVADNTYHDVDLGVVEDHAEALVDTDLAHGHNDDEKGLWAWFSLCLSAWIGKIEEALGMDTDVDANVDAYVSEDGLDLDATAYLGGERVDFDDSELGDLDGMTWDAMADVHATLGSTGAEIPRAEIPDYQGLDVDVCVNVEIGIIDCE